MKIFKFLNNFQISRKIRNLFKNLKFLEKFRISWKTFRFFNFRAENNYILCFCAFCADFFKIFQKKNLKKIEKKNSKKWKKYSKKKYSPDRIILRISISCQTLSSCKISGKISASSGVARSNPVSVFWFSFANFWFFSNQCHIK